MTRTTSPARRIVPWLLLTALVVAPGARAAPEGLEPQLVDQIKKSIDVGLKALCFQQQENGSWAGSPVATALVVRALMESHRKYTEEDGPWVRRALEYLAGEAGPDGVLGDPPSVGTTALAALVLRRSEDPAKRALAERAGAFLENAVASGAPGEPAPLAPWELVVALEALDGGEAGLWQAGLRRMEAVRETGSEGSEDPAHALIALWLLLRSQVLPDDPELLRALAAVGELYPFGSDGAIAADFHYLLVCALDATGRETFTDGAGAERPWRRELARELIDRQQFAGTWPDESSDPSEDGRTQATAYAILALERLLGE